MSRKKSPPPENAAPQGTLKHNPFAALRGGLEPAPAAPGPPPPEPAAASPAKLTAKIVVRREKAGRGGKTITRIRGLPPERLEELASRMKKALGCGAVVEREDLLLLGSLVPRAASWLRAEGATRVIEGN